MSVDQPVGGLPAEVVEQPPQRLRDRRPDAVGWAVLLATVLALVLRVAWGLWAARQPQGLYDPVRYLGYGELIADGKGMVEGFTGQPTAYYPPGYPWFVGIVGFLGRPFTDDIVTSVVLAQAVLGAASVVLGAIVARRLAGPRAAVAAAFGLALYPNLVFHTGTILGETLYSFLFLAFCATVVSVPWPTGLTTRWVAASGVLLGLAVLVRPISLAILPVVLLAWWLASRRPRSVLRAGLVLVLAVGATIVPWTIRNAIRMDAFVPISTNTGENLCIGHAPGANGSFNLRPACNTEASLLDGPAGEVAADKEKVRAGIDGLLEDPGAEPHLVWKRFWYTWVRDGDHDGALAVQSYRLDRFIDTGTEARLFRVADLAYWATCLLGLAGTLALLRRRRPVDVFLVGSALMTAAVPLAFFGDSRFKVPVIPLLIIIAATLLDRPWRREATPVDGEEPEPT